MFTRKLTEREDRIINKIIDFVKIKHGNEDGHDYSHVLEVCKWSVQIGNKIKEPLDPFITICGALLHDIGRVGASSGMFHGLDGGARAEEFLESLVDDENMIRKITKVIVRHTPTSMIDAESVEEKVVRDADTIERLGLMGMVRGIMGKKGSMEYILEDRIKKRLADYDKLYFDVSREFAKPFYDETLEVVDILLKALKKRLREIDELELHRIIKAV